MLKPAVLNSTFENELSTTLRSPAFYDDPYPTYRRMRRDAPLYHDKLSNLWFVSRSSDGIVKLKSMGLDQIAETGRSRRDAEGQLKPTVMSARRVQAEHSQGPTCVVGEGVGREPWGEGEGAALSRVCRLVAYGEPERSLQDEEDLLFTRLVMRRRAKAGRHAGEEYRRPSPRLLRTQQ